mmetsp:Transcript_24510/g.53016  ORF Transcript_24510/g.53016 Transcript_24510/m.53016 type:complete len:174 (-) Transcript_24510:1061-1582(-)
MMSSFESIYISICMSILPTNPDSSSKVHYISTTQTHTHQRSTIKAIHTHTHIPQQFFSGECGSFASLNPGTCPSNKYAALATAQNGRVKHGAPYVPNAVDNPPNRLAAAAAHVPLKTRLSRDSTKKTPTAMDARAELYPHRPAETSARDAPWRSPTRHPTALPPNACMASFGE